MTDQSKLSETSEDRLRAQPAHRWWIEILLGFGIAMYLGGAVVAVIFLDRMGLLPSWALGWISSDREIQKRQFRLALHGLFGFWVAMRLVKIGLIGEVAKTTYNSILLKLNIAEGKPDEIHDRFCAVENVRIAAFLVGFFTLEVFLCWRELGKPFVEHSLYDLLFRIVLLSIVFPVLLKFSRCVPERFMLGIIVASTLTGWVFEYAPKLVDPIAGLVRQCNLVLWILALLTSISLLISSLSKPTLSS